MTSLTTPQSRSTSPRENANAFAAIPSASVRRGSLVTADHAGPAYLGASASVPAAADQNDELQSDEDPL